MARIRTVKPEFWSHPVTGRLDDSTKCMALAVLNLADDYGYFYADPSSVRSFCRPFDDDSTITRRCLAELSRVGYIEIQEHPERGPVGRVAKFSEHQRVDRARPSSIRPYFIDDDSTMIRRTLDDDSLLEGKGKEGNGTRVALSHLEAARAFLIHFRVTGATALRNVEQAAILRSDIAKVDAETSVQQLVDEYQSYLDGKPEFQKGPDKWLSQCNQKTGATPKVTKWRTVSEEELEANRKALRESGVTQ